MAILADFGRSPDFLGDAFRVHQDPLGVVSSSSTRVALRNPETGAVTILTGSRLALTAGTGEPGVTGTLTGIEVRVPGAGGLVPAFAITGIAWSAAEFLGAARAAVNAFDPTRFEALLNAQPNTYDARGAVAGVGFGLRNVTSALTMSGSVFEDTLQGGRGNDTIDPGLSDGGEVLVASLGHDTFDLRGIGPDTWIELDYSVLNRAVQVTLDGATDRGRIVKTDIGTDTVLGVRHTMEARSFDIYGTDGTDTFTLAPVATSGSWLFVSGGRGDDIFNLTLNGAIRLGYDATAEVPGTDGITADLALGTIRDAAGGTDRINILGGGAALELSATRWGDEVTGSARPEVVFGRGGDDSLAGAGGDDTLWGGTGSDTLYGGTGDDVIRPGPNPGRDVIDTGTGADTIDFAPAADPAEGDVNLYVVSHRTLDAGGAAVTVTLDAVAGTGGVTSRLGTTTFENLADALGQGWLQLVGTGQGDRFDIVLDKGQVAEIVAARGNDTLSATGSGTLHIGFAQDGDDIPAGQGVVANLTTGVVANDGFGAVDSMQVGAGIALHLQTTARADRITGRAADDWFSVLGGNDTLRGEGGTDMLDYSAARAPAGVRVDLFQGTARLTEGGVTAEQSLAGFENLRGTDQRDRLAGDLGANEIQGLDGDDNLYGDGFRAAYDEYYAGGVYRLYLATLDRLPDTAGHAGWTARLSEENGGGLYAVADGFMGSREFQNTYGALDNTAFVTLLYRNVLDREPDAAGLADWLGRLAGGATRGEVVVGFSHSGEFWLRTLSAAKAFAEAQLESGWSDDIYRLYRATLGRAPDAAGFLDWQSRLCNGTAFLTAVEGFTGSREFRLTYGTLDDAAFVTLLYRNVLDRDPDAGGLADWLGKISDGTLSRSQVVEGFAQSREFTNATAPDLKDFMRSLDGGDLLMGGRGSNQYWGGNLADTFVFRAGEDGAHRIHDLDAWDYLDFRGFGYDDAGDIRARMVVEGFDLVFRDQGVAVSLDRVVLDGLTIADLTDDMFLFS